MNEVVQPETYIRCQPDYPLSSAKIHRGSTRNSEGKDAAERRHKDRTFTHPRQCERLALSERLFPLHQMGCSQALKRDEATPAPTTAEWEGEKTDDHENAFVATVRPETNKL